MLALGWPSAEVLTHSIPLRFCLFVFAVCVWFVFFFKLESFY